MKIEKGSVLSLLSYIVSLAVFAIILWPIFDWLLAKFINHSTFTYSVADHIVSPIIFGVICGLIYWLIDIYHIKKGKK